MPDDDRRSPLDGLGKSLEAFQETVQESEEAAGSSYTLIGAILLLGGIGYALDDWRGTGSHGYLFGGLVLGLIVGFYGLAKVVFKR